MNKNILGKTGLDVSRLGLGGHEYRWRLAGNIQDSRHVRFNPEREAIVGRVLDADINYFDTTFMEEVQSLGRILKKMGRLSDAVINGMIIDPLVHMADMPASARQEYVREELETRLELLGRDYFDIFMINSIEKGYDDDLIAETIDLYCRFREQGKFRFLGITSHDHQVLLKYLQTRPPVDVIMFPFNYYRFRVQNEVMESIRKEAMEQNLGMVAIKPLCWDRYGIPFTAINGEWHDIQTLVTHNFAWQYTEGFVHTTVAGVETVPELESILAGVDTSCEKPLLAPYLEHRDDLGILARNGLKHSPEVQTWIVNLLRRSPLGDRGDDLKAYL